jgi:hypothetical protein
MGTPASIANRFISGWIPSFKAGIPSRMRQPFCSQMEERLAYHPQVVSCVRGDIGPAFAGASRLLISGDAPVAIGYAFLGQLYDYLSDAGRIPVGGPLFMARRGMEDDTPGDCTLARTEAARRLGWIRGGVFWIGTDKTRSRALQDIWLWSEVASIEDVEHRLAGKFPAALVEAAIWKPVRTVPQPDICLSIGST